MKFVCISIDFMATRTLQVLHNDDIMCDFYDLHRPNYFNHIALRITELGTTHMTNRLAGLHANMMDCICTAVFIAVHHFTSVEIAAVCCHADWGKPAVD